GPQRSVLNMPPSPRQELANRTVAPWEMPADRPNPPTPFPGKEGGADQSPLSPWGRLGVGSSPLTPPARHETVPSGGLRLPARQEDSPQNEPAPSPVDLSSALRAPSPAMQIQDSYLVLETPEGMLVIDQHALHERILFEQLRRRVREGKLEVQRLLIPE